MSIPLTKITKSIKLKPGEQFTLPPGGTLIATTDIGSISSSCEISSLQSLSCYTFIFGNGATDGSVPQLFEAFNFPVVGVTFNGTYTAFNSPYAATVSGSVVGQYDLSKLVTEINLITGGALVEPLIGEHNEGTTGIIEFITFKGTASTANSLMLKMVTFNSNRFNASEGIEIWIKARPNSELSAYSGLPVCS